MVAEIAMAALAKDQITNLITFGDSYTTDGFNISAGVDSPVPGFVSGQR